MNLLEFRDMISSNQNNNYEIFSEEITMFNILNGNCFDKEDINDIQVKEDNTFKIEIRDIDRADYAQQMLNNQIIPGAYKPLYQLSVDRDNNFLIFNLIEV